MGGGEAGERIAVGRAAVGDDADEPVAVGPHPRRHRPHAVPEGVGGDLAGGQVEVLLLVAVGHERGDHGAELVAQAGQGAGVVDGEDRARRPRPARGAAAGTARRCPGPGSRGLGDHVVPRTSCGCVGGGAGDHRRGQPPPVVEADRRHRRARPGAGCRPTRSAAPRASRRDRSRSPPRPPRAAAPTREAMARSRNRPHIVRASGAREPSRLIRGSDSTARARSPSSRADQRRRCPPGRSSATRSPARRPASRNGRATASSSCSARRRQPRRGQGSPDAAHRLPEARERTAGAEQSVAVRPPAPRRCSWTGDAPAN